MIEQRSGMPLPGDMTCEQHPWRFWPHDDCSGPGMAIGESLGILKAALRFAIASEHGDARTIGRAQAELDALFPQFWIEDVDAE